jgi:hypothetical protein
MVNLKRGRKVVLGSLLATVLALAIGRVMPVSAYQAGTTLTATLTAAGHWKQTFAWDISKTVSPDTWNLPLVETGTSQFTIAVNKHPASDKSYVEGQICVTNGGSVPTENLQIVEVVQYKNGSGKFLDYATSAVDLSAKPVLSPGESYCYPYRMAFVPVAGAVYRSVAHITITNHSGWMPGGQPSRTCSFGPNPKADFSLPASPDVVENGAITVSDTNGMSWSFSDSGSVTYARTFVCMDGQDQGTLTNVATILETGLSASASVVVNCVLPPPDPGAD